MMKRRTVVLIGCALAVASCSGGSSPAADQGVESTAPSVAESAVVPTESVATTVPAATTSTSAAPNATTSETAAPTERATVCLPAPPDTTSVYAGPQWQVGDQRDLEVEIRKSQSPGVSSITPATLTVTDSLETGWRFDWEAESTLIADLPDEVADFLEDAPKERVVYSIALERVFLGAENIDEIRANTSDIADLFEVIGMPADQVRQTRDLFDGLSDEALGQMFSERPQAYHVLEGYELSIDEPLAFDDLLPNAFGGQPFPALTTIELTEIADADGCAVIELVTILDPEQLGPILQESLVAAGFLQEGADLGTFADFTVENSATARYDATTGLLVSIEATQAIRSGDQERVDQTIIRDVTK